MSDSLFYVLMLLSAAITAFSQVILKISANKKHKAFIVTNDLFRDYLDKIVDNKQRETERMWIQETRISYTFNQDEFLPNSDAAFFKEFQLEEYNRIAT